MNGWFKFHRKTFENPIIMKDAETLSVWVWLLGNATFDERRVLFGGVDRKLNKGELVTTTKFIANELKINESKVNRILKMLENEKQIEKQTTSRNTLIYIVNWEKYQSDEKQNEEQMTNERKTNDKQVTNERQTSEEQMTTIQESNKDNNDKKEKESKKEKKEDNTQMLNRLLPNYPISETLSDKIREWIEYKIEKKETYVEKGMNMLIKKISENAQKSGDFAVMDLIDMCMANNWKGIIWDKLEVKKTSSGQSKIDWDNV